MAKQTYITSLFNEIKTMQQDVVEFCFYSIHTISEINKINNKFIEINHKSGDQFCNKVSSTVYELIADNSNSPQEQEKYYLLALEIIELISKTGTTHISPTLPKRQGRIKSKLSDLYHKLNQHIKANALAKEANAIFYKTRKQFPKYFEIILEQKKHWFRNLKWIIQKEMSDLERLKINLSKDNRVENYKSTAVENINHLNTIENILTNCQNLKSQF